MTIKQIFTSIATACALLLGLQGEAGAGSTINPNVPAQNSPLQSAPIRGNFAAAYNDINNLVGMNCSGPLVTFQLCASTTPSPYQLKIYDGSTLVQWGALDPVTHTFASTAVFANGDPWCDVKSKGAIGNGIANDSAAFAACRDALVPLFGGVIFVPPGVYCLNTGYANSSNARIAVRGAGALVSVLHACGHDVNVVSVTGVGFNSLEDVAVFGKGAGPDNGTFGATQSAVYVGPGSGGFKLSRVYVNGGKHACEFNGSNDNPVENALCAFAYGDNVYVVNSPGMRWRAGSVDQNPGTGIALPAYPYTFNNWTNGHAYTQGTVVKGLCPDGNTYYWQAVVAGTSGGGLPTCKNYLVNFSDNTVTWQIIAPTNTAMFRVDGGIEVAIDNLDMSGFSDYNFWISANGAGGAPQYVTVENSILSLAAKGMFFAQSGSKATLEGNHMLGCIEANCFALGIGSTWGGGLLAQGNFFQFASIGVVVAGGATGYNSIVGNYASNNTIDFYAAPNAINFTFAKNICGGSSSTGVLVDTGASTGFNLDGNVCNGATVPINDMSSNKASSFVIDSNLGGAGIADARLGTAQIGTWPGGTPSHAFFGNAAINQAATGNYALIQDNGGATIVNAASGQSIDLRINNVQAFNVASDRGLFLNAATGSSKGAGSINAVNYYTAGVLQVIPVEGTLDLFVNPNTGASASCKDGTLTCGAGNDTTGNGTSATPWATIQKCVDELSGKFFMRKAQATCWVADNTNITQAVILRPYNTNTIYQSSQPAIRGNCATPGNTVIKGASTGAVFSTAATASTWTIQGFDIAPTAPTDIAYFSDWFGNLNVGNTRFTSAAATAITSRYNSAVEILANGGAITCAGSLTVSAGLGAFAHAYANSTLLGQGAPGSVTLTLTGTPAWSNAFAICQDGGYIDLQSFTFVGSATGQRYSCGNGSKIAPAGTALPGNVAGQEFISLHEPSAAAGLSTIVATATGGATFQTGSTSGTFAVTANTLGDFAATTSAQLFAVISDETGGSGVLVGSASPTFTGSPVLSTPSATTIKVGTGAGGVSNTSALVTVNATTYSGSVAGATTLLQLVGGNGTSPASVLDAFAAPSIAAYRRANTSAASPSALAANDQIGIIGGYGHDGTSYGTSAFIEFLAAETFSGTAHGGNIAFFTVAKTTTTLTEKFRMNASGGLSVGATATGTDPGSGNIILDGTLTVTGLATDATHTDRTVCQDTTSKSLFFGSGAAGICLGTSSERFKRDIAPYKDGLALVAALEPKTFRYREGHGDEGARQQFGLIAEDLVKVEPRFVGLDVDGRPNSVDWPNVVWALVNSVKELDARLHALERR